MSPTKDRKLEPEMGKLYLIPLPLSASGLGHLPQANHELLQNLGVIIAEKIRTARRFVRSVGPDLDINAIDFHEIDKHNPLISYKGILRKTEASVDIGLMSEAGCPGIADPGAKIVAQAHDLGIEVVPLTGPSSIVLALMASGLNGQGFVFLGYLPRDQQELRGRWRRILKEMDRDKLTRIFIETPYRNQKLVRFLIQQSPGDMMLSIASDLTGKKQRITTLPISKWKKRNTDYLHKNPAIFLAGMS